MYPACFFKKENGYSVIFPALDLAACGETIEEAITVDCLAGRFRWLKQNGCLVPEPSPMDLVDLVAVSR